MSRISLAEPSELDGAKELQFKRFPANLTRALLRTSNSTEAYLSLGASFAKSRLSPMDRELAILRVGALSASAYERMQHLPIARRIGWGDDQISAIENGDQAALGPRYGTLLRFVDECVQHVRVSDPVFDAVREFLGEEELAEITLLIGHYMMTARFLETLDVPLDEEATDWTQLLS